MIVKLVSTTRLQISSGLESDLEGFFKFFLESFVLLDQSTRSAVVDEGPI